MSKYKNYGKNLFALAIKKLTIKQLQEIEDFLNNLPRKVLGYKTPNEVWEENINLA
uniref:hypothetical protein n=1 Tax=Rickettsia endosymbiont of Urophora cardui TaxID=3066265 RepID=UPI00313EDC1C